MNLRKVKNLCLSVVCCMALALVFFQAPAKCYGFDIEIDVSPNVLNIQSESSIVTVHTDIAYNLVVGASVFLNGVVSDEIKTLDGLIIGDYNTLTLNGFTTGEEAFIGTQDIKVIDNIPAGAGKE